MDNISCNTNIFPKQFSLKITYERRLMQNKSQWQIYKQFREKFNVRVLCLTTISGRFSSGQHGVKIQQQKWQGV